MSNPGALWTTLALLLTILVGACGDDEGGPLTEWLSEGSGEVNMEPLEPLMVGSRRLPSLGAIDAIVEHEGRRLYRYQLSHTSGVPDLQAVLLHDGADGVEMWFSSQDGWLKNPIMFVPKVARVGKKWRAKLGDKPLYEYEVISRKREETAHGEQTIWTIRQRNLTDDFITERRYIEGLGLTELNGSRGFVHTNFAMPLEAPSEPTRPTLSATAAKSMGIESELLDNLRTTSVSLVRPWDSDTALLIVKGWAGCPIDDGRCPVELCFQVNGDSGVEQGFGVIDTYHRGTSCTQQRLGQDHVVRFTSDASGALVTPSDVYWVPRDRYGNATDYGVAFPIAIYADSTLAPRLMKQFSPDSSQYHSVAWKEEYTTVYPIVNTDDKRPLFGNWSFHQKLNGTLASGFDDPPFALSLAPPGEPLHFAWVGSHKMLMHSTVTNDVLSTPVPVTTLTGQLSVTTDQRGQHMLLASADGSIDRVVVAEGKLVPEAIGRVRLPAGETLVAAVDLGDRRDGKNRLLIATHSLRTSSPLGVGSTRFYTTEMQAPVRFAFPAGLGVTAADFGADVVVCWPETNDTLETTGWSVAGVPAQDVLQITENCALISRDVTADPIFAGRDLTTLEQIEAVPLLRYMPFYTEGPVPGVGRMRLGADHSKIDYSGFLSPIGGAFAALSDGGYATADRLFTAGGVELGYTRHAEGAQGAPIPDRKGAGLWIVFENGDVGISNRQSQTFERPTVVTEERPWLAYFASPDGGIVINYGSVERNLWFHLNATGSWTELPAPAEESLGYLAQKPNGDLCGLITNSEVFCADSTGAVTSRVSVPQDVIDLLDGNYFNNLKGLEDGSFLLYSSSVPGTYRFVPEQETLELWHSGQLSGVNYDFQNRPYGVIADELGERRGGYLGANGFEPIDLGEWKNRYNRVHTFFGRLIGIYPGLDRLWVLSDGCSRGTCNLISSPILWP